MLTSLTMNFKVVCNSEIKLGGVKKRCKGKGPHKIVRYHYIRSYVATCKYSKKRTKQTNVKYNLSKRFRCFEERIIKDVSCYEIK